MVGFVVTTRPIFLFYLYICTMNLKISQKIKVVAPALREVVITADVVNLPTSDTLWQLLLDEGARIRSIYQIDQINKRPGIAGTRAAYKALGKEPNRYRPSTEALCRRLVKGLELYRINALVDIINLLSVRSGYSIGGFDADRVAGDTVTLGVGEEGEPFEAIGRGQLNIACLPVLRDSLGPIGTPTSDHERTKLTLGTRRLLMSAHIYNEEMPADEFIALTDSLLTRFCSATNIKHTIVKPE